MNHNVCYKDPKGNGENELKADLKKLWQIKPQCVGKMNSNSLTQSSQIRHNITRGSKVKDRAFKASKGDHPVDTREPNAILHSFDSRQFAGQERVA